MSFFRSYVKESKHLLTPNEIKNYETFDENENISETEIEAICLHEEQMSAMNEQLRTEIQNKPQYFKELVGEENIRTFLSITASRPNLGVYEKFHAQLVEAADPGCSDRVRFVDLPHLPLFLLGALSCGAFCGGLGFLCSILPCAVTTTEKTIMATAMLGAGGAMLGGCGTREYFFQVDGGRYRGETFNLLQQHRQEIGAYSQQFKLNYLKMMEPYKKNPPQTQSMEDHLPEETNKLITKNTR